jgi:geranylgeranyl diphosphate synthase type II
MSASPARAEPRLDAELPGGLRNKLRSIESYLARALPRETLLPGRLHAAMRYGVLAPGKRVRPLLVLTACEAVGGRWLNALPAAAAVECVHAFSLIHDDLPAMDDDDYRRGRLATHRKFGEPLGILSGDALLALAFDLLGRLAERGVPADRVVEAVRVLARAAGSRALVGGQVLDLEAEGREVNREQVRTIHSMKTGELMGAALVLGGIVGGADEVTRAVLLSLGVDLGVAFQIHDDLLNQKSSPSRLGKPAGTDAARGKATYPRAVGEERSRREAERIFRRALETARAIGPRPANLEKLIRVTAKRRR